MLFSLVSTALVAQSGAVRPEVSQASVSAGIANIGSLLSKITGAADGVPSFHTALGIVESILAEEGNATEHMSDEDANLLRSVITLVETTIYGSMDQAHAADVTSLDDEVAKAQSCNSEIAGRQSETGDLGEMLEGLTSEQNLLDNKKADVDVKTVDNNSAWEALDLHMQLISAAPACPAFPSPSMTAMDSYFDSSDYAFWYTSHQTTYQIIRGEWSAADEALTQAISEYNIQLAIRDVKYCDYKLELEVACTSFDTCFGDASNEFTNVLVPRVASDASQRAEAYKAGETLIHQIKFLLGDVDSQDTPDIDTGRYEITPPSLPAKGVCDLSPLDDPAWVPTPTCVTEQQLIQGCKGRDKYSAWRDEDGVWERKELSNKVAGEAVCCNDNGKATRHVGANGLGFFPPELQHDQCTTTKTTKLIDGTDGPSHTFDSAKAVCKLAGMRLCKNQDEVDTACGTGCHINFVLVWIED